MIIGRNPDSNAAAEAAIKSVDSFVVVQPPFRIGAGGGREEERERPRPFALSGSGERIGGDQLYLSSHLTLKTDTILPAWQIGKRNSLFKK